MSVFFEVVFKEVMRFGPYGKVAAIGNGDIVEIHDRERCKISVISSVFSQSAQPVAYGFNAVQVPATSAPSNFFRQGIFWKTAWRARKIEFDTSRLTALQIAFSQCGFEEGEDGCFVEQVRND